MAKIDWDPTTMATGVPEVDAQHQEWIRRYNQFDEAISQGKGLEAVKSTLDFFLDYAEIHFQLEEAVMDERHSPAAKANKEAHDHMRNILKGFKDYATSHGYSVYDIISLKYQMQEWLVKHILTVDIKLRDS